MTSGLPFVSNKYPQLNNSAFILTLKQDNIVTLEQGNNINE